MKFSFNPLDKRCIYCPVVILLFLISCDRNKVIIQPARENYTGLWTVKNVTMDSDTGGLQGVHEFNKGRYIMFYKDKKYTTTLHGEFDHGTFEKEEAGILLKSSLKKPYKLTLQLKNSRIGLLEQTLNFPDYRELPYKIHFNVLKIKFADKKMDPFSVDNNRWQIPPDWAENDSLLASRLINHFDFWIGYLNLMDQTSVMNFDYSNLNTFVQIFPQGITITKQDKWPSSLNAIFFSPDDAKRAYKILLNALYKSNFVRNENAYIQNIGLMKQISYHLDQVRNKKE